MTWMQRLAEQQAAAAALAQGSGDQGFYHGFKMPVVELSDPDAGKQERQFCFVVLPSYAAIHGQAGSAEDQPVICAAVHARYGPDNDWFFAGGQQIPGGGTPPPASVCKVVEEYMDVLAPKPAYNGTYTSGDTLKAAGLEHLNEFRNKRNPSSRFLMQVLEVDPNTGLPVDNEVKVLQLAESFWTKTGWASLIFEAYASRGISDFTDLSNTLPAMCARVGNAKANLSTVSVNAKGLVNPFQAHGLNSFPICRDSSGQFDPQAAQAILAQVKPWAEVLPQPDEDGVRELVAKYVATFGGSAQQAAPAMPAAATAPSMPAAAPTPPGMPAAPTPPGMPAQAAPTPPGMPAPAAPTPPGMPAPTAPPAPPGMPAQAAPTAPPAPQGMPAPAAPTPPGMAPPAPTPPGMPAQQVPSFPTNTQQPAGAPSAPPPPGAPAYAPPVANMAPPTPGEPLSLSNQGAPTLS